MRTAKPEGMPQEMWDNTLAGQGEKITAARQRLGLDILKLYPRWLRRRLFRSWSRT